MVENKKSNTCEIEDNAESRENNLRPFHILVLSATSVEEIAIPGARYSYKLLFIYFPCTRYSLNDFPCFLESTP